MRLRRQGGSLAVVKLSPKGLRQNGVGRGDQTGTTATVKAGAQKRIFGVVGMVVISICLTVMKRTSSKLGMKGYDRRRVLKEESEECICDLSVVDETGELLKWAN